MNVTGPRRRMSMKGMGALTWFMVSDEAETWHTKPENDQIARHTERKKEDTAEQAMSLIEHTKATIEWHFGNPTEAQEAIMCERWVLETGPVNQCHSMH